MLNQDVYLQYIMGFGQSKAELKALAEAKKIRQDLYLRINSFKALYKEFFEAIPFEKKEKIMKSSAVELAQLLDENWTTSAETLFVFVERVCTVGIANNYVLDEIFEYALEQARKCDDQRKKDQWKKKCWRVGRRKQDCYPPFYGVPTSLKDCILFKGKQSYMGLVSCINQIPTEHTQFSLVLLKTGLIPFVRSNVPQGCKTFETHNNIIGYSSNPWNKERSCGGSSGGQSGMVASYCAPFGVGTDLGGSLRIPAEFTGICTLKPGHKRISNKDNCFFGQFQEGMPVKGEIGPMSSSVEDIILFTEFFCDKKNFEDIPRKLIDPYVTHVPLDCELFERKPKFKIGLLKNLNNFKTSKPNKRAIMETAQILKSKGNEVIEIKLPHFEKYIQYLQNALTCDQEFTSLKEVCHGEPLIPEYSVISFLNKIPWLLRKILAWIMKRKYPRLAELIYITEPWDVKKFNRKTYQILTKLHQQTYSVFGENHLDVILMPTTVSPAPYKGQFYKYIYSAQYTCSWNVIRYPAGTVPVTIVKEGETDYKDEYNDRFTREIGKNLQGSEGMPVGVQIVSTPYNEEKVLYMMNEIEKEVRFRQKYAPKFI